MGGKEIKMISMICKFVILIFLNRMTSKTLFLKIFLWKYTIKANHHKNTIKFNGKIKIKINFILFYEFLFILLNCF